MSSKQIDYTGQVLDNRYRVIKQLATGGMGSIYLGKHLSVGRKVAVKFLHEDLTEKDDIVMRFFREAQAAAAVRHKNIIDVLDMGTSERGEPYLVMEYLEGESLADLLKRTGPMNLAATCAVLEQVLFALGAAHDKGIVHRDLKPDNIFMAWIPGEALPVVKLIDFGVSKLSLTGTTKMTITGTQFGTPTYMAPEQIRGDVSLNHRADLYSVGVVMYRMLTGKLPFTGQNNMAVFAKALTDDPMPLEEAYKDAPVEASPMVMRLLKKNADERYASASAVLDEMRAFPGFGERFEALSQYFSEVSEKTFAGGDLGKPSSENAEEKSHLDSPSIPPLRTTLTGWSKEKKTASSKRIGPYIAAGAVLLLGIWGAVDLLMRPSEVPEGIPPQTPSDNLASVKPAAEADNPASAKPAAQTDNLTAIKPEGAENGSPPVQKETPGSSLQRETVELKIEGAPEGSKILFNDKQYDTPSFLVEKSVGQATLKIFADGYTDYETRITPDRDRVIPVRLESAAPIPLNKKPETPEVATENRPTAPSKMGSKDRAKERAPKKEIVTDGKVKRTVKFED